MKRTSEEVAGLDVAKMLMLLSCRVVETKFKSSPSPNQVFQCKTCNRQFPSFQALGGHRASHKKPRTLMGSSDQDPENNETDFVQISKLKRHECSICGVEFSSGQALGGHMRRHRMMKDSGAEAAVSVAYSKIPVLMRSNSKRVMCLDMDLNLTPLENDLQLLFGKMAPKVDVLFS